MSCLTRSQAEQIERDLRERDSELLAHARVGLAWSWRARVPLAFSHAGVGMMVGPGERDKPTASVIACAREGTGAEAVIVATAPASAQALLRAIAVRLMVLRLAGWALVYDDLRHRLIVSADCSGSDSGHVIKLPRLGMRRLWQQRRCERLLADLLAVPITRPQRG